MLVLFAAVTLFFKTLFNAEHHVVFFICECSCKRIRPKLNLILSRAFDTTLKIKIALDQISLRISWKKTWEFLKFILNSVNKISLPDK